MRQAGGMGLLALLALAGTAAAQEPTANAALRYWQALGQLPEIDAARRKLIDGWRTAPLDAAVDGLLEDARPCLDALRRGALLPRCDWGLDFDAGPDVALAHLTHAKALGNLACLRARRAFARNQRAEAVADASAAVTFGRHLAGDAVFLGMLIGYGVEQAGSDALAAGLPQFDAAALDALAARLDRLPPAATMAQALDAKRRHLIDWLAGRARRAATGAAIDWRDDLRKAAGSEECVKAVLAVAGTPEELARLLEATAGDFHQAARLATLPPPAFAEQWPAFAGRLKATHPATAELMSPMDQLLPREWRQRACAALLRAAVAVARHGPAEASKWPDLFGDGPFAHRPLPSGFELRSKLTVDGNPVLLRVGGP